MTTNVDGHMWSMSLNVFDVMIIFVIFIYIRVSSVLFYDLFLDKLGTYNRPFKNSFKNKYNFILSYWLILFFWFLIYVPIIQKKIKYRLDHRYLEIRYITITHSAQLRDSHKDEIKIIKRKLILYRMKKKNRWKLNTQ